MPANQLSKGIVQAHTVKATRVEVNGVPVDASVTISDLFPAAPVEVTGINEGNTALQNLLGALETLGLITDSTTAA